MTAHIHAFIVALEDILIAAKTIYGESRGEDYPTKLAVAHVILNRWRRAQRAGTTKDSTIARVCYRDMQFSTWNANDPNFQAVQLADVMQEAFRDSMRAILEAVNQAHDPTGGALHYHDESIDNPWPEHNPSLISGRLLFYNTVPF